MTKDNNSTRHYYIRVDNNDAMAFYKFCARTRLEEYHHSNGFIGSHAGTTLFSLTMTDADRTAMALALPVSIMIQPTGA